MERHTRSYLQLIKPGITISNTLSAIAGFSLASSLFGYDVKAMVGVIVGVAFVIASACVINNMLDRGIDKKMKRTKGREIAAGHISLAAASAYATVLTIIGFGSLFVLTNMLTFWLGVIAFVWYVVIYGIAKRTTVFSTIIGGVCGALPPVAGYTAISGSLDAIAWTLFALLMVWQLPHFYAISVFRRSDYKEANLPVWSVKYGTKSTKVQIFFWVVIFALISPLLTLFGATGYTFVVVMLGLSLYWIYIGIRYYHRLDDVAWSRKMFGVSLIVLLAMCAIIAVGHLLP